MPIFNCRYQLPTEIKLMNVCSFLDPRTKSLPYLSELERAVVRDDIHAIMDAFIPESKVTLRPSAESDHNVGADEDSSSPAKSQSLLFDMFDDDKDGMDDGECSKDQIIKQELNCYMSDKRCDMNSSPLAW